jgi:hypothetical protein
MQLTSGLGLMAAVVVVVSVVGSLAHTTQASLLCVGTSAHALHPRRAIR